MLMVREACTEVVHNSFRQNFPRRDRTIDGRRVDRTDGKVRFVLSGFILESGTKSGNGSSGFRQQENAQNESSGGTTGSAMSLDP